MADGTTRLEVLTLDSGARRALVSTTGGICCPAWSPDGREIAYGSSTGPVRFWRVASDGGAPALLTEDSTRRPTGMQWVFRDRLLVHAITHYAALLLRRCSIRVMSCLASKGARTLASLSK